MQHERLEIGAMVPYRMSPVDGQYGYGMHGVEGTFPPQFVSIVDGEVLEVVAVNEIEPGIVPYDHCYTVKKLSGELLRVAPIYLRSDQ